MKNTVVFDLNALLFYPVVQIDNGGKNSLMKAGKKILWFIMFTLFTWIAVIYNVILQTAPRMTY